MRQNKKFKTLTIWGGSLAIFSALALFNGSARSYAEERYSELQLFTKVLNLVQQYYVEEVDTKKLIYGGIKGMLKELDPHTNFLPPEIYKEFESETSGQFGGIGIEITVQNGVLTVLSPIEDTPAWKAGIHAGDKIVSIDGESTKGFTLVEAAKKMRGVNGSKVKMGIYRDDFDAPKDFIIERGVVKIKSVKFTDLNDGYGYIRITSFIENTAADLLKAVKEHQKDSKGTIKGYIIDLRKNPGGLLDQAIKVSDMFLSDGVIVSTIGRNKKEKETVYAVKKDTFEGFPIVVVIDEFSASASEIVAGALQDNKRAMILGKRSFGKGSVQSVVKLGDGSGLKLTVARYYTPSGKSIQAEGIVPDVELDEIDNKTLSNAKVKKSIKREKDMSGHLLGDQERAEEEASTKGGFGWWSNKDKNSEKGESPRDKLFSEDFQVLQAYNYLKTWSIMKSFEAKKLVKDAPETKAEPKEKQKL